MRIVHDRNVAAQPLPQTTFIYLHIILAITSQAFGKCKAPLLILSFFPNSCSRTMMENAAAQIAAWVPKLTLAPVASAHVTWK